MLGKNRLIVIAAGALTLAGAIGVTSAVSQGEARGVSRVQAGEEKWIPYPGQGGQLGIQQVFLYGDPAKPGPYALRIKFPAGVMSRPHSHSDDRTGVVIKGTWWTGDNADFNPSATVPVRAGGFVIHPKGEAHYDGARGEEVIVQLMGMGPSRKTAVHPDQPDFSKQ
jgi:quercetin dioxygenase-like cupin family protein